jgi:protein pelota
MGRIAEAPEDIERGYHSIDIKPGSLIKIQKEWRTWEINRIRAMAEKIEPILICILDDREADFYVLRETAHHLFHLSSPGLGKEAGVSKKPEYYGSILSELKKREEKSIILAGPGFTREEIAKLIKDKEKEVAEKVIMDSVSHTGEVGLQELLRRGSIDKIVKNSRISRETQAVESVLIEIARDGKAVYGLGKVREIIGMGAADLILVSDKKLGEFEEILKNAEKTKSKIMVISSEHQSGEKLYGLGGIAALLRFQV